MYLDSNYKGTKWKFCVGEDSAPKMNGRIKLSSYQIPKDVTIKFCRDDGVCKTKPTKIVDLLIIVIP